MNGFEDGSVLHGEPQPHALGALAHDAVQGAGVDLLGDDDLEDLKALVVLDAEGLEALDVDALFREDAGEGGDDVVAVVAPDADDEGLACGGLPSAVSTSRIETVR